MKGEVGALYQGGKQVAVFYDWEATLEIRPIAPYEIETAGIKAHAYSVKKTGDISGNRFVAEFHQRVRSGAVEKLALVIKATVEASFVDGYLEMIWHP